jgi:hypothetical protein
MMPRLAIHLKAAVRTREMLLLSLISPCVQKGPILIDKYEDQVASQGQLKPRPFVPDCQVQAPKEDVSKSA